MNEPLYLLEKMTSTEYSYYGNGWEFTPVGVFTSYDEVDIYLENQHLFKRGYNVCNMWPRVDVNLVENHFLFPRGVLSRTAHAYTYIQRIVVNDGEWFGFYDNGVWRVREYTVNTKF